MVISFLTVVVCPTAPQSTYLLILQYILSFHSSTAPTLKCLLLVSNQFYPRITHLTSNIILILQSTHGASSTTSNEIGLPSLVD